MSNILDIPTVEAFSCNTDDKLASEWEKKEEMVSIGIARQEILDTLSDIGTNYSAIATLDSYFVPTKNLIY